ncbi:hypothetical protein SAMN05880558_101243 [Aeromonas sp. RU39B]|nr:hypothetical protein [Aeromonas sp. RU39B]SIP93013.1 hypothetical protein SAMN05880558_101243 [Aeromonas sp. RU39B]
MQRRKRPSLAGRSKISWSQRRRVKLGERKRKHHRRQRSDFLQPSRQEAA